MKSIELSKLKPGDKVVHKRYLNCEIVDKVPGFGPVIKPTELLGQLRLKEDSGVDHPYVCTDWKKNLKLPLPCRT